MTKRPLDEQELGYTKKGIKRLKIEVKELEEQKHFNQVTIDFQKAQATYQEIARPYLKRKKEQEDQKIMGTINEQIARSRNTLENLEDQIKHGITIKLIQEVKDGN